MTQFYASSKTSKNVAQIGITNGADVSAILLANDSSIRQLIARLGRLELYFTGGNLLWNSTYNPPQGLDLRATNETVINVTSPLARMFEGGPGSRGHQISGDFIIDGQDNITDSFFDMQKFSSSLICDGITVQNTGANLDVAGSLVFRMGTPDECELSNIKSYNTGTFARWDGNKIDANSKGSKQRNCELIDPCAVANIFYGNYHLEDFLLENPKQNGYSAGAIGGQCIQTRGETWETPDATIKNLTIINPILKGRPGVGYKANLLNGATGDMIVLRGVDGWLVDGGRLSDGGEFGGDTVHGTKNGLWRGTLIERMDGSGMIMGTPLERDVSDDPADGKVVTSPVENNHYRELVITDCGIDHEGTPSTNYPTVPHDALGYAAVSGINVKNVNSGSIQGCTIARSRGAGLHISNLNTQVVNSFQHENNNYENNGSQLLGYDAVYTGQTATLIHDGNTLGPPEAEANSQTWTGVGQGVASVNGDGGLYAYRQEEIDNTPWKTDVKISIDRSAGAYNLVSSGGSTFGWYKGYFKKFDIAQSTAIPLQHIRAGGQISAETTIIDANQYEPAADGVLVGLDTASAATTRAQMMRLFLDVVTGKWYLQYGQKAHTTMTTALALVSANEDLPSVHSDGRMFIGTLIVKESAPNFNTTGLAVWIPNQIVSIEKVAA